METTSSKIISIFVCETTDWSAEQVSEAFSAAQSQIVEKLSVSGSSFEHQGTEYQMMIFSEDKLTKNEINVAVRNWKKGN